MRLLFAITILLLPLAAADTVALWLFDEQRELYPSSLLNDAATGENVLVLGRGARLVEGRFGNALEPMAPAPLEMRGKAIKPDSAQAKLFGLTPLPVPPGRTMQPLWWQNATFAALLTSGEKHLRSGGFPNIGGGKLNLGSFDWTLEFWLRPEGEGVIYEVGRGPRGENAELTRLSLAAGGFVLQNGGASVRLPAQLARGAWQHVALVHHAAAKNIGLYVDGRAQGPPASVTMRAFERGGEAYLTIGRDGRFEHPLAGRLDEMRVSAGLVYTGPFTPPGSLSLTYGTRRPSPELVKGPPLLFAPPARVIDLGGRKHLFLDDALAERVENVHFAPQPPKRMEKVADEVRGHLCVIEDDEGLLRLYYRGTDDILLLMTSRDGVHWERPDLGREVKGHRNAAIAAPVGLGVVIRDPNAPPEARYKYLSGTRRRSIFVYGSADGNTFTPHETAALPFGAGSQSSLYYDDQRQLYVAHHRSDYGMTQGGATERRFVLSEVKNLLEPWPVRRVTRAQTLASRLPVQHAELDPWYLDNGPLSPGGFGLELPLAMAPDPALDPPGTDIYVTKALKYPLAPDAYLAFPAMYFHYWEDGPKQRRILGAPERKAGSGVIETQVAVSRDGLSWRRFPRPAYIPAQGKEVMLLAAFGLIRRGDEIWQYAGGHGGSGTGYHSPFTKEKPAPLYRYVQRLDGFVAAEGAYGGGRLVTRPLKFTGKQLELNIDTGAVGYAQVGILDEGGRAIPGFSVDDCVYLNGDHPRARVEWLGRGKDVSALAGRVVKLEFRLRGAKLYAMQFVPGS